MDTSPSVNVLQAPITEPSHATPGALVAAGALMSSFAKRGDIEGTFDPQQMAQIIDKYSGLPDLLAACKAAKDWLDRFGAHAPITFGGEQDLHDKLTDAIALAEGGQS